MPGPGFVLNGQVNTLSEQRALAQGGAMFVTNCQTPGTAIAYAALTTFSATANGLFVIANTAPSGGKSIYLHRLELFQTATPPVGTAWSLEVYNETGIVAGTTAVITRTPVQVNSGIAQTSVATVQAFNAGAITIPAAVGTRRLDGQGWIQVGVCLAKDNYVVDFGSDAPVAGSGGATAVRAVDTARKVGQMPAVVIPPQTTSWINLWGCGTNVPSFEYNLIHSEI